MNFLCDFEKEYEIAEIARQALLKERKYAQATKKTDVLMEVSQKIKTMDYGKNYYKPFDETVFEGKIAVDLLYYKHLLKNLDETHGKDVNELLAKTYRTVKQIYEFVNIEPRIYGKNIDVNILENSIGEVEEKLSTVLNETLNDIFYSLTPEKRLERYSSKAIPLARHLITENSDPEEAMKFSIKSVVIEEVCRRLAFPGANWLRVLHLTESEDFGLVFDQDKLVKLVETFEKQINKLSKYLASCI